MAKKSFTYKEAGVDIKSGEELVNSVTSVVRETHNKQVLSDIGGFGALFAPDLKNYPDPVLVSSVDGVGTKLIVAFKTGRFDTIGQDLVNHCVNDIAVCGARPLFFLDYFSTGKLEQETGFQVIHGFSKACKENDVALIGGETAEMPDIYKKGEFDLAGTIVGIVNRDRLIRGEQIEAGNRLIGIPSSGLHTNGYSLARNVLFSRYKVDEHLDELDSTLGEALLAIHKSYLELISRLKEVKGVHGFSHVTGGGIEGNTRRVLPEGLDLSIDWDGWERPALFDLIQKTGNVPEEEMRAAFNLGVGLVVIADSSAEKEVSKRIREAGEQPISMGKVIKTG